MISAASCCHAAVPLLLVAFILYLTTEVVVYLAQMLLGVMGVSATPNATRLAIFATRLAIFAGSLWWRGSNHTLRTYRVLMHVVSPRCEKLLERGTLVAYLVLALCFGLPWVSNSVRCTTEDVEQAQQWFLTILEAGDAVVVEASALDWRMTSLLNPSLDVEGVDKYLRKRGIVTLSQVTPTGAGGGDRGMLQSASVWVYGTTRGDPQTDLCCVYPRQCCWGLTGARRRGCDRSTGFATQPAGVIAIRCTTTSYK